MRASVRAAVVCVFGCAPLEGAEIESGTTGATEGVASSTGTSSTGTPVGSSSTGDASSGGIDGSSGSGEVGSDTSSGGSETTASVDIECTWTEQPNADREWGVCGPPQPWQAAEDYCVSAGGNLVSFAGATDNVFAINVLSGVMEAWIGLNDITRAEAYEWSDGTVYDYMNWDDSQPDGEDERCVAIGVTQRWFDFGCEETRRFVCARAL